MFVYLLMCSDNSTYVGATVNLERRLRQHNKEIKGGARATGMKVEAGNEWKRICYISGFPNWSATLQFEWRWKQLSRKLPISLYPLERRMTALKQLLMLERATSKAIPYSQWEHKPVVHVEDAHDICSVYIHEEDSSHYLIDIEEYNEND